MHKINILFGNDAIEAFEDNDFTDCSNWYVQTYRFNTMVEKNCFLKGLQEMEKSLSMPYDTFNHYLIITDSEVKRIDCSS